MLNIDQPRIRLSTRISLLLVAILNLIWFFAVVVMNFVYYTQKYGYAHHVPITFAIGGLSLLALLSAATLLILNRLRLCKHALVVAMVFNALAMLIDIIGGGIRGDFWLWWFFWVVIAGLYRWLLGRSIVRMIRYSKIHDHLPVVAIVLAILTGVSPCCLPYVGGFYDFHQVFLTNARWTLLCAVIAFTGILMARRGGLGGMKPRDLFSIATLVFVGASILTTVDFFHIADAGHGIGSVGVGIWLGLFSSIVGAAVSAVLVATQDKTDTWSSTSANHANSADAKSRAAD